MKLLFCFLSICLVFISCSKEVNDSTDSSVSKKSVDWNVRFEVDGRGTVNKAFMKINNGMEAYYVGNSAYVTSWPDLKWTKDTIFKATDGSRTISLNVLGLTNSPGYVLYNGDSVLSRIYVNGTVVKEGKGVNQFITTELK